jgi:hypothetical protein
MVATWPRAPAYSGLRGKLDVPKERFISYPGCESDEDHESRRLGFRELRPVQEATIDSLLDGENCVVQPGADGKAPRWSSPSSTPPTP